MKIVFFGKGLRGSSCLDILQRNNYHPELIISEPLTQTTWNISLSDIAKQENIPTICPENPNTIEVQEKISNINPDLIILAGYGRILKKNIFSLAPMCINLHAGQLPKYRGSSPMNWALINDEKEFTLTILTVNKGIDTGDILLEKRFPIQNHQTIKDLHLIAKEHFPLMLLKVLTQIEKQTIIRKKQVLQGASYYPRRFPEDGIIAFDQYSARQIHNRIRALSKPYTGATTLYGKQVIKLMASQLSKRNFYGEPGRIYQLKKDKFLICASDQCLWITSAYFEHSNESLLSHLNPYDQLFTVKNYSYNFLREFR